MFIYLRQLFKLQFLLILIAILVGIYYTQIEDIVVKRIEKVRNIYENQVIEINFESAQRNADDEHLFTKKELMQYNGEHDAPIYLAILGSVYDVTKGSKHYGADGPYNYFVGRDASVSFISGGFKPEEEDIADDVLSLKKEDLLSIVNWQKFYEKQYTYKGKVIGRFYDENGEKTKYFYQFVELVKQTEANKAKEEEFRVRFPDCNVKWSAEEGTHVWCSVSSGGKERNWVGYPRKLYEIGSSKYRCACVKDTDLNTKLVMLKLYENCDAKSEECFYKTD